MVFYHGGAPGLRIGQRLLPPAATGADHSGNWGAHRVHDPEKVYVTPEKAAALMFASLHPSGDGRIYRVETVGLVEYDPDCSELGLSYTCDAAIIRSRVRVKRKTLARGRKLLLKSELRGAP